ncbi:MAG: acyltransferase [Victivallaceae bacterium]|nr:acyltransferase [Victivallaceae bacterium]
MKTYPSLLSLSESTAIKGLLIALVVLGHNPLLMDATGAFPYIYSFHIYCFYMLPFLYGMSPMPTMEKTAFFLNRQKKNLFRFYPLYFFWALVSIACRCFIGNFTVDVAGIIRALLTGSENLLAQYCGGAFLWFLPTLVAVMFFRDLYFLFPRTGKAILFVLSLLLWILPVCGVLDYWLPYDMIPFALLGGLRFCTAGIAARFILEKIPLPKKKVYWAIPVFLLAPGFVALRRYLPWNFHYLTWLWSPIAAFCGIYLGKEKLVRLSAFCLLGEKSLAIYWLHPFFYNLLRRGFPRQSFESGLVIFGISLMLCLLCAITAKRLHADFVFNGWKHSSNAKDQGKKNG